MIRALPIIALIFFSCSEQKVINKSNSTSNTQQLPEAINSLPNNPIVDSVVKSNKPSDFSVRSIQLENGWGYQIYKGTKLFINQKNIPAVQGNQSFTSERDALKVGEFVINKLLQNQFPPTVTVEELISLGIVIR
jgi:hypothetical protein